MKEVLEGVQKEAIECRNKNLLISASAGCGKTYVMTKRIVDICVKERVPITSFLVVTFTKAAALEMKNKIIDEFSKLEEKDEFIKEQISLTGGMADVSTLHGFCAKLLKQYFYAQGLDPAFVVLDEEDSNRLIEKSLKMLFDKHMQDYDKEFLLLADILSSSRNEDKLKGTILKLFNFLQVKTQPDIWFNNMLENSYNENLEKNCSAKFVLDTFVKEAEQLKERAMSLDSNASGEENLSIVTGELVSSLDKLSKITSYENLYLSLENMDRISNLKHVSDEKYEWLKDEISSFKTVYSKFISKWKDNLDNNEVTISKLLTTKQRVKLIYSLTMEFAEIYQRQKKEKSVLDFADLEKYTVKLLEIESVRNDIKDKYRYIFVDEYQDTSEVQEFIISQIKGIDNLFMVGDIKQSIYRFRYCEPDIFLNKFDSFNSELNPHNKLLLLNNNFRSDKNILNFVNLIFDGLMTTDFGGVDYHNTSMLNRGGENIKRGNDLPQVGLMIVTEDETTEKNEKPSKVYSVLEHENHEDSDESRASSESKVVAELILSLQGKLIYNAKGEVRPITYKDITILTESRAEYTEILKDVLTSAKIPNSSDNMEELFSDEMLSLILDVLKIIDNRKQDLPLFSVLSSKLFDFNYDELARIRISSTPYCFFYEAMEQYANNKDSDKTIIRKINTFFNFINKYYIMASFSKVSEILLALLKEETFEDMILLSNMGTEKLERVNYLITSISEKNENKSLSLFLTELTDKQLKVKVTASSNSVNITSIHKSKGLDYPIVILVKTGKDSNKIDIRNDFILSKSMGVGLINAEIDSRIKNETLVHLSAKLYEEAKQQEERARLLYVALTRAVNHLFIVGSIKEKDKNMLSKRVNAESFLDWILPVVNKLSPLTMDTCGIKLTMIGKNKIPATIKNQAKQIVFSKADDDLVQKIDEVLSFKYPYEEATELYKKATVTRLTNDNEEFAYPIVFNDEKISSTLGSAYHLVMQNIDFAGNNDIQSIIVRLVDNGKISHDDAEKINIQTIIYACENIRKIAGMATIHKEKEFFSLMEMSGEEVIIQGVVDLILERENDVIIVDYKLSSSNDSALKERYAKQLEIYASATERALGKPCSAKYIYSFTQNNLIQL
ncbi:MAG: UvrD-helicase domain-containing protein [Clostridia bacterium]